MGESFRGNFSDYSTSLELRGIYRGIVVDRNDNLNMGRCRVRVFGVHTPKIIQSECEGVPNEHLPWAEQVAPLMGGSSGAGAFMVPLVGTIVFVFFERGDPQHPRYFGVLMGKTAPQSNDLVNSSGTSSGMDAGTPGEPNPNVISNAGNICQAAQELGVDPCQLQAVSIVESGGGSGMNKDGTPVIRYESHKFYSNTTADVRRGINDPLISQPSSSTGIKQGGGQGEMYRKLNVAMQHDPKAAVRACSWGKYQIMGFNASACGYTEEEFMTAAKDPNRQEEMFSRFVQANKLTGALKAGGSDPDSWRAFARGYNGTGYEQTNYHTSMARHYNACKAAGGVKGCEAGA